MHIPSFKTHISQQDSKSVTEAYLTELGNRPYPFHVTVSVPHQQMQAQFTIPETGMVYKVDLWVTKHTGSHGRPGVPGPPPTPSEWEFGFGQYDPKDAAWNSPVTGNDSIIGQTGVEIPVFATVAAILKQFVHIVRPMSIVYSAKVPSRQRLYARFTRLVQHIIPGYTGREVSPGQYQIRRNDTMKEHIVKTGDQYKLVSKSGGKNLGTYDTKAGAEKGERQVQYFKHLDESEYEGRTVTLNKPFRTADGPKKFSVYVNNEKGNVVKVNFGDPDMEIKRDDPDRRANYRARHNCDDPGPKWKANYWSCKNWASTPVSKITEEPVMTYPTFKEYLLTEAEGGQLTSQVKAAFANAAAAFAKIVPEDQIYAVAAICEYLASQSLYGPEKSYLLSISKHLEELHDLVNARASDKVRPARSADKIAAIARDSHNQEVQAARARYSLMMHQVSIVKAAFAKMAPEDQIYAVAEFCNYLISQPLYSPEKSVLRATSNQLEKLHDRVSARVLGNQLFTRTH